MNVGRTATFQSILDKPLNQLTKDDISQLTREDCHRFLKEKGMHMPLWNKSHAIQQVITRKALLEPSDDVPYLLSLFFCLSAITQQCVNQGQESMGFE
ncbi:hypothetical protein LR48_Vigan09g057900 [Vigna angularis]|uniref:Protein TIFY 4A Protein PEAPOD 1 n=1 Tax=Phaseolus angularis TaxID=3914 RepID=A0A0L9V9Z5_PHAAN|nr:Protein TIFY 4A Protein PEAPOD 1 [Vigna angularis]KOM51920.1 hypothetical protein LR48_Vigan09g057900 [Vigna angularis]